MIGAFPLPLSVTSTILSGGIALGAGTVTATSGTVAFADSNGVTFGMVGNTVTASISGGGGTQSTAPAGLSAAGGVITSGTISFANSNGVSFGVAGNTVTASAVGGGGAALSVSAGTLSGTRDSLVFSNSNGVSFGMNGSTITGSVNAGGGAVSISAGTLSGTRDSLVFSNSNGVSFGLNGSTITATVATNYLTTAMASNRGSDFVQATAAFAGTNASGTIASNGISVSVGPYITTARASTDAIGLNTAQSNVTWTVNSSGISLDARGYAGTNGAITNGSLTVNSSGVSINLPNYLTTQSGQAFSADASSTFQTLTFQDSNGISFSNNAGALRLTHALQFTSATSAITSNALHSSASRVINIVAATNNTGGGTASLSSNVSFSNANGLTFYTSAGGAVVGSYTVPTVTNSAFTVSDNATSGTVARLAFTNLNGVTLSLSSGAGGSHTIVGSHNALTSQSNQAFSAQGGSSAFQTLSFANSFGVSFSNSNGSVAASIATSLTNINVSAGTTSNNLSALTFANSNSVTFGLSGSQITASFSVGTSVGVLNFSAGTSSANINSLVFSDANGVSWGLNGSTVTGSVPASSQLTVEAPLAISQNGSTLTIRETNDVLYWDNIFPSKGGAATNNLSSAATAQNTISVFPFGSFNASIRAKTFMFDVSSSASGNSSSAPKVFTIRFGLYTLNGSTLSLANSCSFQTSIAANAAASTGFSGQRWVTIHSSDWSSDPVFSGGVNYYGAVVFSSGGNNSAAQTGGFIGAFPYSTAARSGYMGVSQTAATHLGFMPFHGIFTASSNLPVSIDKSNVNAQSANANFVPHIAINNLSSYL